MHSLHGLHLFRHACHKSLFKVQRRLISFANAASFLPALCCYLLLQLHHLTLQSLPRRGGHAVCMKGAAQCHRELHCIVKKGDSGNKRGGDVTFKNLQLVICRGCSQRSPAWKIISRLICYKNHYFTSPALKQILCLAQKNIYRA